MREKLEKIIEAYKELEAKLGDPEVLANQHEYNKLAKNFSDQGPLVAKAREYIQCLDDLAEAKEMLSEPDMKEFAQEEISRIEGKLPQLEEDIKIMLIPSDPADEKNIIVEIRAAAGGDEAAISQAIYTRCTCVLLSIMVGKWKLWTFRLPKLAAIKKFSSRLWVTKYIRL